MRNTGRIIAARIILLVVVLVVLGFAIFKLLSNDSPSKDQTSKTNDTSISKQKAPSDNKSSKSKDTQKTQPAKSSTPPASTTPSTTPSPAPAQSASGQNLTNSGPGSVVALFAGTIIVGALMHNRLTVARYRKAHE